MNILKYEFYTNKRGLKYALVSSLLVGFLNHITTGKGIAATAPIGVAEVIGGALAPIVIGSVIGFIRSALNPKYSKSASIKHSIFITAVIMFFLILTASISDKSSSTSTNAFSKFGHDKVNSKKYKVALKIPYQFSDAGHFSKNGLAPVMIGGELKDDVWVNAKYGYIDRSGSIVINPIFDGASEFSDSGFAWVLTSDNGKNKYALIDKYGNYQFKKPFDFVNSFSKSGLAIVSQDGKNGIINLDGVFVVPPIFGDIRGIYEDNSILFFNSIAPSDGVIAARMGSNFDDNYGFINLSGSFVIKPQFNAVHNFSKNGLAAVLVGATYNKKEYSWVGGKWGFINRTGDFVIPPQFDDTGSFAGDGNELAPVRVGSEQGGKWGYINVKGKFIVNPIYDGASDFVGGIAQVHINQEWNGRYKQGGNVGLILNNGKYFIDPIYLDIDAGEKGNPLLIWAKSNSDYHLFDENGDFVFSDNYNFVRSCNYGLCAVQKDGKWGFVEVQINE